MREPARRGGWEFEPGLVDLLLRDVGAEAGHQPEPGALPLYLVFGMLTTKDASGFLRPLARHAPARRAAAGRV